METSPVQNVVINTYANTYVMTLAFAGNDLMWKYDLRNHVELIMNIPSECEEIAVMRTANERVLIKAVSKVYFEFNQCIRIVVYTTTKCQKKEIPPWYEVKDVDPKQEWKLLLKYFANEWELSTLEQQLLAKLIMRDNLISWEHLDISSVEDKVLMLNEASILLNKMPKDKKEKLRELLNICHIEVRKAYIINIKVGFIPPCQGGIHPTLT